MTTVRMGSLENDLFHDSGIRERARSESTTTCSESGLQAVAGSGGRKRLETFCNERERETWEREIENEEVLTGEEGRPGMIPSVGRKRKDNAVTREGATGRRVDILTRIRPGKWAKPGRLERTRWPQPLRFNWSDPGAWSRIDEW